FPCTYKIGETIISVRSADQDENSELPVIPVPGLPIAAEAYFSPDGKSLICNAKVLPDDSVHHVYTANIDGTEVRRINDKGEDACSYYFPSGDRLIWTSTKDHPELPVGDWSIATIYPQGAELYSSDLDGSNVVRLTNNEYYDAEVSLSPDGQWILFTRQIDGKLNLWRMRPDGTDEFQITHTDDWQEGGSFYMPDSETILYRGWKREYDDVRGKPMTIFTIKHDGTEQKQITHDDGTNWAPHPGPDGKRFVFVKVLPPHNFEIFLMNIETGKQLRLTYSDAFDGFPVISPDGKKVMFSSSRSAAPGERKLSLYLMDISSLVE
ncbi:MAG: PD40 domain-containing protein, partial [Candidatus Marinimicrobia bacterium]|nr:PD40 domain-containing protein [Candidatus Neomarinimicrobiota bacterium]